MRRRGREEETKEKILDVDATMQGTLSFRDPVNLRINGSFEGSLDTKGNLTIGENAVVKAGIKGENIIVAGRVYGDIAATKELTLRPPAHVTGNITTPRLSIVEGAVLEGKCHMTGKEKDPESSRKNILSTDELAEYLEVDSSMIFEWANAGKLPGVKEKNIWKFNKAKVDEWVANGKVK
jgi:excisionase family DNA binding protein